MIVSNTLCEEDMGTLYGFSLFETFLVSEKGNVFLLQKHIARLYQSAIALNIDVQMTFEQFEKAVETEVEKHKKENTILRVTLTAGNVPKNISPALFVTARKNTYTYEKLLQGALLQVSDVRKSKNSKLVFYKTANYLENFFALQRAAKDGFDDALFLNEDKHLTETAKCNLFFVKKGMLYTPKVECGLLDGIIRGWVLKEATRLDIPCRTGDYTLDDLLGADEAFETNSAMGLCHIQSVNHQPIGKGTLGPVTECFAKELYSQMEIFT